MGLQDDPSHSDFSKVSYFERQSSTLKGRCLHLFPVPLPPFLRLFSLLLCMFVFFFLLSWLGRQGWDRMEAAGPVPKGSLISSSLFQQFRGSQQTLAEVKHKTRERRFSFTQRGVMWGAPCQGPSPMLTEWAGLGKMVRQRCAGSTTCIGILLGLWLSLCG